jgi:hypothetical protein
VPYSLSNLKFVKSKPKKSQKVKGDGITYWTTMLSAFLKEPKSKTWNLNMGWG